MEHLLVLLYTLAFATGAAAAAIVFLLSRNGRPVFFRDYVRFLFLINICVALNLASTYGENVGTQSLPLQSLDGLRMIEDLAGMALVGGFVQRLVRMMRAVIDRAVPHTVGNLILGLVVLGTAAMATIFLLMPSATRAHLHAAPRAVNLLLIATAVASTVQTWAGSFRLGEGRSRTVRWFAGLHAAAFLAVLLGFFAPPTVSWYLLAGAFLCVNSVPLVLSRSLRAYHLARPGAAEAATEKLRTFAAEHGISTREMEIVAHVLTGRTNVEVAASLFISASTVKNHIHSVYQKCGARNRVELARLIDNTDSLDRPFESPHSAH